MVAIRKNTMQKAKLARYCIFLVTIMLMFAVMFSATAYASEIITADFDIDMHIAKDEGVTPYEFAICPFYDDTKALTVNLSENTDITDWFQGLPTGLSVYYKRFVPEQKVDESYTICEYIALEISGNVDGAESKEYTPTATIPSSVLPLDGVPYAEEIELSAGYVTRIVVSDTIETLDMATLSIDFNELDVSGQINEDNLIDHVVWSAKHGTALIDMASWSWVEPHDMDHNEFEVLMVIQPVNGYRFSPDTKFAFTPDIYSDCVEYEYLNERTISAKLTISVDELVERIRLYKSNSLGAIMDYPYSREYGSVLSTDDDWTYNSYWFLDDTGKKNYSDVFGNKYSVKDIENAFKAGQYLGVLTQENKEIASIGYNYTAGMGDGFVISTWTNPMDLSDFVLSEYVGHGVIGYVDKNGHVYSKQDIYDAYANRVALGALDAVLVPGCTFDLPTLSENQKNSLTIDDIVFNSSQYKEEHGTEVLDALKNGRLPEVDAHHVDGIFDSVCPPTPQGSMIEDNFYSLISEENGIYPTTAQLHECYSIDLVVAKEDFNNKAFLTELDHPIKVTIPISHELYESIKDRKVFMVRAHQSAEQKSNGVGDVDILNVTLTRVVKSGIEYGELSFYTDKFSTFAIASAEKIRFIPSGGGTVEPSYQVSVSSDIQNGTVSISKAKNTAGKTVEITVSPNGGYAVKSITVKDASGNIIELKKSGNICSFTMPAQNVTITVLFTKAVTISFVDVTASDYYYEPVIWAFENGITEGVSETKFAPENITSRAQTITFLWRAAGCPEPLVNKNCFTDVSQDAYYYKAVLWAIEQKITFGTSTNTFSPEQSITRAQAVTFMARFAGATLSAETEATQFTDVAPDAYYASAVSWAALTGITEGVGNNKFAPDTVCNRANIVSFLYRYFVK